MATPPRRRKGRGRRRLGERIEHGGLSVLTWAWAAAVRLVRLLVAPLAHALGATRRALARQRPLVRALAVAAMALACVAAVRAVRARRADPVVVVDDAEALARVIRSEAGISPPVERVHVAWATRNLAAERGQSIAQMACSPCGPQQRGRPVSSSQAATDEDRQLARHVLAAPKLVDPTGGATHFVNPALQDELAARGRPGYRGRPYAHVRRVWKASYGWEPYYRLSPALEMWGPRRRR